MAASLADSLPLSEAVVVVTEAEAEEVESSLGSATERSAASCCCWLWSPCIMPTMSIPYVFTDLPSHLLLSVLLLLSSFSLALAYGFCSSGFLVFLLLLL
jgi:hypothetical protein